jgi:hypothetical protein
MTRAQLRPALALLVACILACPARSEIVIVLQNGFIKQNKRRVTIEADFTVDKAHKRPNPPAKDGDLHVAGRSEQIKLPTVAEIMNARDDREAVKIIHDAEGTDRTVRMSGVWRLWCEHGGNSEQIQGKELDAVTSTNPDHVFEIHPITKLNDRDLLHTLKPIPGYSPKDAQDAFTKYEGLRCRIVPGDDTTTVITTMAGYNYVEFVMEIVEVPQDSDDGGLLAMCSVRELDGELLVRKRRMVMAKGSQVEQKVRGKPIGTRAHVLGIPRMNLSLLQWRLDQAKEGRTDVLSWGLPYEIIVVGFFDFVRDDEDGNDKGVKNLMDEPAKTFVPKTFTREEIEKRLKVTSPPLSRFELDALPKSGAKSKSPAKNLPPSKPAPDKVRNREIPDLIEEK